MILVTGGTGYIGSHTVVELQSRGESVVILDNLSNSSLRVLDRIEQISGCRPAFVEADIRDRAALDRVFAENKIEAVVHFAGLKAVGESVAAALLRKQRGGDAEPVAGDARRQSSPAGIQFLGDGLW